MKASANTTIIRNKAKTALAGYYYPVILAVLFSAMVSLLVNRFAYALISRMATVGGGSAKGVYAIVLYYLIPFATSILLNVMQVGICFFYLNLTTSNPIFTFQLLYGYTHMFEKSIKLSAIMTTISFVCTLPINIVLDLAEVYYESYHLAYLLLPGVLVLLLLQVVFWIVYIYVSLNLSQVFYLMLDYPDMPVRDVLKTSVKIMKGKKLQLFHLQLSFLPLYLLIVLTFGVGLFWLIPYKNTAYTLYYLDLMKPTDPTYQP